MRRDFATALAALALCIGAYTQGADRSRQDVIETIANTPPGTHPDFYDQIFRGSTSPASISARLIYTASTCEGRTSAKPISPAAIWIWVSTTARI